MNMSSIHVAFELDDEMAKALRTGRLERVGGVIREADTKRIVAWLRQVDASTDLGQLLRLTSVASTLDLACFRHPLHVEVALFRTTRCGVEHSFGKWSMSTVRVSDCVNPYIWCRTPVLCRKQA